MRKWHPASGNWGIFGRTQGAKVAEKTGDFIEDQKEEISLRRNELEGFFSQSKDMIEESSLSKFLNDSYSINTESEQRKGRSNLASVFDLNSEKAKQNLKDSSESNFNMQLLNVGRQEQDSMYTIDDLLRQLDLEKLRV